MLIADSVHLKFIIHFMIDVIVIAYSFNFAHFSYFIDLYFLKVNIRTDIFIFCVFAQLF